jgi:hypothetical protein
MEKRIIPLIMCGGAGTRLWPASREVRPKQFLSLFGKRSTFQDTLVGVSDAALFERPIVITNAAYRFMVLEQLAEIGIEADVILEPARRDSGPAIAAGAHTRDSDGVVLALAADHVVGDAPAFIAACRAGLAATQSGRIVTFGIKPERAAGEYDQLHHFIADGVWDAAPLETELLNQADRLVGGNDAVLVIDDTAVPKKGEHSVGVAAQYASALDKTANWQPACASVVCWRMQDTASVRRFDKGSRHVGWPGPLASLAT